ncbi:hypothetical protein [Streptomyces sp. NPDC057199]|uniref:hypothetical protein n=1 Tax=Streptomyces sp. NPDC057199 TaxID=3346047 RepID=UPI0036342DC3
MDWAAPVSALIGGVIAVASGWAVERGRWRREDQQRERDRRTVMYADYLAALLSAREQIWYASRWYELPDEERVAMARDALRDHDLYPMRHRIALVSPPDLGELAYQGIRRLRFYRDAVLAGARDGDAALQELRDAFRELVQTLIDRMRVDLESLH